MITDDLDKKNTIFYMVDMQNDFVNPNGALYVPNAETLIPTIQRLQAYARDNGIREYASVDRHFFSDAEITDAPDWSKTFPPHCMDGTIGQKIVDELKLAGADYIGNKLDEAGQQNFYKYDDLLIELGTLEKVVFEKQSNDVATNKHFAEAIWYLKSQQGITNVVVYGVATDYCVKDAVKAFQDNGFGVFVVRDAIAGISQDNSNKALDDFVAHDARLISSLDILRRDHG